MNPLITLLRANEYFAERLHSDAWLSTDDDTRTKAIMTATRMLASIYIVPEEMFDETPEWLESATCEQAIYLLTTDPNAIPGLLTKGFKSAAAGPVSVTADWEFTSPMIAVLARQMIGEQLEEAGGGGIRATLYERSA